jgi:hypothetical protein
MTVDDPSHADYIETFSWQLVQRICSSLESECARLSFVPHFVADESVRHLRHAQSCAKTCLTSPTSRKMTTTLDAYLESSGRGNSVLCLYGASGCGKSMFVAESVIRLSRTLHEAYHAGDKRSKELQAAADAAMEASSSLAKFKEKGQQIAKTLEALRAIPFVYVSSIPAILVRFIGLTSESSSVRNLISSICQQMHKILVATHNLTSRSIPPLPPLFDLEAMKAFFTNMLRTWSNGRLIIFLDGLDELEDTDAGRVLDWLPVDGLSAMVRVDVSAFTRLFQFNFLTLTNLQVRLIVTTSTSSPTGEVTATESSSKVVDAASAQPCATEASGAGPDCFSILKGRVARTMMVEFPAMEDSNILLHMFALNGRCVTETQSQILLQVMRRFPRQQSPIVAAVLAQRFIEWPSYIPIPSSIASFGDDDNEHAFFDCRSLSALCCQLFRHLEERHGRHLVRSALAYVSLARFGVSETELFELLSLSDDVLAEVYEKCQKRLQSSCA